MEDQAFSPSYDLAPPPHPPSPFPSASCLSFSVFLFVSGWACWRTEEGEGVGEEPNYTSEKAWVSINHSIFSEEHKYTSTEAEFMNVQYRLGF
jgi:hypothetical protein